MVIAIDLDGVVFDTEDYYRTYAHLYDIYVVKNGIKNKREMNVFDRHGWSKENANDFYGKYTEEVLRTAPIKPGAKFVLDKLKEMGHKLICVTLRGYYRECEISITEERLKQAGIEFDKIIYSQLDKVKACKDEGVECMVEDSHTNIERLSTNGIKCLHFKGAGLREANKNDNVTEVQNWADVLEVFINR